LPEFVTAVFSKMHVGSNIAMIMKDTFIISYIFS